MRKQVQIIKLKPQKNSYKMIYYIYKLKFCYKLLNLLKEMLRFVVFLVCTYLVFGSSIVNQQSLALTIYNNNFAIVKDVRLIQFDQGQSTLYFTDVAANIQPDTVIFRTLQNTTSVRVYEQNFQQNLVNTEGILQQYINKSIILTVQLGTNTRRVTGTLLGYNGGYIIQTSSGIQIYNKIAAIQFPTLPGGFFTNPTLDWRVYSQNYTQASSEIAYRTSGVKWSAHYTLILNQNQTEADFASWVTIDNFSGKRYREAKIKLVAGDVNIVNMTPLQPFPILYSQPTGNTVTQQTLSSYELFTLDNPVTINDSTSKQIQFIPKVSNIPVETYSEIRINAGGVTQSNLPVKNYVRFVNSQQNGLGIPLPNGIVRVFKEDITDGALEFIGEDNIKNIPIDQNVSINTGKAFDIVADKIALSKTVIANVGEYTADVTLNVSNRKDTSEEIVVIFVNNYGDNLKISVANDVDAPQKVSTNEYKWTKTLDPNENWQINWREDYIR